MTIAVERSSQFWLVYLGALLVGVGLLTLVSSIGGDAYRRRGRVPATEPVPRGVKRVARTPNSDHGEIISRTYRRIARVLIPVGVFLMIVGGVLRLLA